MGIYFQIAKFNFLRFLAYPWDTTTIAVRRVIDVGLLLLFWSIVARSAHGAVSLRTLTSYFLVSTSLNELMLGERFQFGQAITLLIKRGDFSNYLLKPVSILPQILAREIGRYGLNLGLAGITLLIGISLNPPRTFAAVGMFFIFLVIANIVAFSLNVLSGTSSFHITETVTLRNALNQSVKVFGGAWVPLTFFPGHWRALASLTPFPAMIFGPVNALQFTRFTPELRLELISGLVWAGILAVGAYWYWKRSLSTYDAVGI
jgi:ABC-2 type transport system permease protein